MCFIRFSLRVLCVTLVLANPIQAQDLLEIDHIFIIVPPGAHEAQVLQDAGFSLAPDTSRHVGQGTASVFFRFENVYLELIWVVDEEERDAGETEIATRMARRERNSSPFGVGLRTVEEEVTETLPFSTRSYQSAWMRPGTEIRLANDVPWHEPLLFVLEGYMRWTSLPAATRAQVTHASGTKRLTAVHLEGPGLVAPSTTLMHLAEAGLIHVESADEHKVEIELDNARTGQVFDARPTLPLVIRY